MRVSIKLIVGLIQRVQIINILHVYKTSSVCTQGGIEEVIKQLALETTKLGVHNKVVCLSADSKKKEILETKWATVYCYPLNFEIASCGFSWELLRDFRSLTTWADIVHNQFPWPFADVLSLACRKKNTPYIVSYQSDIIRQRGLFMLYRFLMTSYLKKAKAIVATSPKYISSSPVLAKYKKTLCMIPNGISDAPVVGAYQVEKEKIKKKHGDGFFLFIGVFRYYKGISYLLDAAKNNGLPVLLVGSGPEESKIKKRIREDSLDNVTLLGRINENEKHALISLATALVLPSSERSEAYGMVLLEAARQGLPMISTELGSGTSYINIHEETGLVVAAKNSKKLSEAMSRLAENKNVLKKMTKCAEERFKKNFTVTKMGERYLKLYQKVLRETAMENGG